MDQSKYHLNTVHMQSSQQLTPGPYEYLRNRISQQNFFNPRYIDKSNQTNIDDAMGQLKKFMAGSESLDSTKLSHIHSIKLHPIINENFISTFDENQYRLDPNDKVKIVKQKVFRIQNYYNYLYELQCQKQHKKLQQKTQTILQKSKHEDPASPKTKHIPQKHFPDQIINDYQPNSEPKATLAPLYTSYEQKKIEGQQYFLKEKQRKQVEESSHKRF